VTAGQTKRKKKVAAHVDPLIAEASVATGSKRARDASAEVESDPDQPAQKRTSGRSNAAKKLERKSLEAESVPDIKSRKPPKVAKSEPSKKAIVAKTTIQPSWNIPMPHPLSSQQRIQDMPVSAFLHWRVVQVLMRAAPPC
jgi:hypothetical protein